MKGTKQQTQVWKQMKGDGHFLVRARAGTGKTTTLVEGASRLKGDSIFLAFNRHIADELGRRLPSHCQSRTLHSLGLKTLGRSSLDEDRDKGIFREIGLPRPLWPEYRKLFSLMKANLSSDALGIRDQYDIELLDDQKVAAHAKDYFSLCLKYVESRVINFDDMIWGPIALGLSPSPCEIAMIDEAQDLSKAQRTLALRTARRVIAIGDDRQSIMGFAGADSRSFHELETVLGGKVLPLTTTFRCPRSHVELAKRIVADFQARPGAEEGEVVINAKLSDLRPGDMAICRTNAPLVAGCLSQIREGKRACVRGRDIGQALSGMIRKLADPALESLSGLEMEERYKIIQSDRSVESRLQALEDRILCARVLLEQSKSREEAAERAEQLFVGSSPSNSITFSSIHRAKGLEADNVLILRPELLPLKWGDPEQEMNLVYVALTRAKKRLAFAGPLPACLG